jgi:recombination protein RecR
MKKRNLEKFNNLVDALGSLPTVGKKSAMRYAFHLLLEDHLLALKLSNAIESALSSVTKCSRCGGLSEDETCYICSDDTRDFSRLCLVESAKDIFTLEESGSFEGRYFVLENLDDDSINRLKDVIELDGIEEIIFAISPSIATDALILHVEDQLIEHNLIFTKIAQGVPTGVSLENIDTMSLNRSIEGRLKV